MGCLENVLGGTCYKNSILSEDVVMPLPPSPQLSNEDPPFCSTPPPPLKIEDDDGNKGGCGDNNDVSNSKGGEKIALGKSETIITLSCFNTDEPIRCVVSELSMKRAEIIKTEAVYVKSLSKTVRVKKKRNEIRNIKSVIKKSSFQFY